MILIEKFDRQIDGYKFLRDMGDAFFDAVEHVDACVCIKAFEYQLSFFVAAHHFRYFDQIGNICFDRSCVIRIITLIDDASCPGSLLKPSGAISFLMRNAYFYRIFAKIGQINDMRTHVPLLLFFGKLRKRDIVKKWIETIEPIAVVA